jgi:hypothetical protein
MEAAPTRYEVRVGTLVSKTALAMFRVPVKLTAVRRNTVYRFRVPADRDLSHVLHRLTERDVQVLEIRRCTEPRRRDREMPQVREQAPRQDVADPADPADPAETADGVVVPFRARAGARPRGVDSAGCPDPPQMQEVADHRTAEQHRAEPGQPRHQHEDDADRAVPVRVPDDRA